VILFCGIIILWIAKVGKVSRLLCRSIW